MVSGFNTNDEKLVLFALLAIKHIYFGLHLISYDRVLRIYVGAKKVLETGCEKVNHLILCH